MFDQLIAQFTGSRQGQTAMQRLQAQGFAPHQATQFIGAAVPAAAQSMHSAQAGGGIGSRPGGPGGLLDVGNSHYLTNFLSGAVSGLMRGEGMMGAAVEPPKRLPRFSPPLTLSQRKSIASGVTIAPTVPATRCGSPKREAIT